MAVEEGHVHGGGHFVDGITPVRSPAVIVTVVEQGLVGNDQQRAVLLQVCRSCLEVCDGLGNRGSKALGSTVIALFRVVETGRIAVIGTQVAHAQRIDVVIAVVIRAVNAVVTGTVDQAALLVNTGTVAVMVGPDIVDRHIAQNIPDVARQLGGITGILGGIRVDGKCIAAAGNTADGQTCFLKSIHNTLDSALFVVAGTGMQITENDSGIDCCSVIRGQSGNGQHADNHHQHQHHRNDTPNLCFHVSILLFSLLLLCARGNRLKGC